MSGVATMTATLAALAHVPARDTREAMARASEFARAVDERTGTLSALSYPALVARAKSHGLPVSPVHASPLGAHGR